MMRRHSRIKRILSLLLTFLMLLSLAPAAVFAASGTYQKVTDQASFTSGKYILVTDTGYTPGVLDGTWISAVEFGADTADTIQNPNGAV